MCHPAREMILLLRAKLRKSVIDDAAEFINIVRLLGQSLDRRLRVGENLLIVLVTVDNLFPDVNVIESWQRAYALAHVLVFAGNFVELVKESLGEKVRVGVDVHGYFSILE